MTAYYNEHDPFAAAWLRELIKAGHIAAGDVDERSIEDICPSDLVRYRQCHFFAGIGIWSLAARQSGISDETELWTGSCPCQPFSSAGKGGGFDDERHLWPAFHYLIEQCQPSVVVGEQVASKDGLAWLDLVSADMEGTGYAFGSADICAAGFGAPHIRQRLYWTGIAKGLGDASSSASQRNARKIFGTKTREHGEGGRHQWGDAIGLEHAGSGVLRMADTKRSGQQQQSSDESASVQSEASLGRVFQSSNNSSSLLGMAHPSGEGRGQAGRNPASDREANSGWPRDWNGDASQNVQRSRMEIASRPSPTNGYWRDADWLRCTDEKWRPVEPSTFPLADAGSIRNRVGMLRGAGNAITIAQSQGFLEAVMECRP